MSTQHHPAAAPAAALPAAGYVRLRQLVPGIIPVHKNTIPKWVQKGRFPKPVRLSYRVSAWRVEDVRAWMDEREGQSNG